MKKKRITVSSPDQLDKYLQHTSPFTWLILGAVSALLLGFFVWSFVFKLKIKLIGDATIQGGEVTLQVADYDLSKLKKDQTVIIEGIEGKIVSFDDNRQPIVSKFDTLADGEYTYTVIYEKTPISFLIGN